jgi:hypothetical protein
VFDQVDTGIFLKSKLLLFLIEPNLSYKLSYLLLSLNNWDKSKQPLFYILFISMFSFSLIVYELFEYLFFFVYVFDYSFSLSDILDNHVSIYSFL